MLVEVGKFTFLLDFIILEMEEDSKVPIILGRPFLHTTDAVILSKKQLNLGVVTERMIFHIDSAMKHSYSNNDTCFRFDVIDEILGEDFDALLDEGNKILYSIEGTPLEEKLFVKFDEFIATTIERVDMTLHWSGVGAAPLMSPRQDKTSEPLLYARWMAGPYRCNDATRGRNDDPMTSGSGSDLQRLDMILHWSGVGAAPLMSPRQDKTSEPLLYTGWMAGPYRCKDAMQGRNDDPVTSGCRSSVRMTMHEVVHEMVVGEWNEPNSEGSGFAWKAYMNARVASLFMLVLLEYPNGKGVDKTSEPLLYAGWMAGPYRCKDATRGRNDDPVTQSSHLDGLDHT
uniref:Reverse transcriptase domain-containing protein n=1 Tax=Tanacetum cinerariifolium TaxID=118510 RepID=A0A699GRW6_TANCI|nr:reverse transcriptase domain-containing protein [Tanacetum cinerariifolium]